MRFVAADILSVTIRDFSHKRISAPLRRALKKFAPLRDIFKGGYPLHINPWVSRRAGIHSVALFEKNALRRTDYNCVVETVKSGFSTERFDPLRSISHGPNR